MLFLEYVRPFKATHPFDGFLLDARNRHDFMAFVGATAQLNAIQLSDETVTELPEHRVLPDSRRLASTLDRIWICSARGELGTDAKSS